MLRAFPKYHSMSPFLVEGQFGETLVYLAVFIALSPLCSQGEAQLAQLKEDALPPPDYVGYVIAQLSQEG
jgi:hypothetical protein